MNQNELVTALNSLFTSYCILIIAISTGIGALIMDAYVLLDIEKIVSLGILVIVGVIIMYLAIFTHSKILNLLK